jgi:signal transduction histidine kinase
MHLIHDLRLVLAAVSACLEMLRKQYEGQPLPNEVDNISRLLDSGFAMVDELLVSSTLRHNAPFVDVNSLLEGIDPAMSTVAGPQVKLQTTLVAPDSRVYGQRVDIERIMLNLVFNAIAAMPSGGALSIETDVTQSPVSEKWSGATPSFGNLRLTVRDTGRGMSELELAKAMNPMAKPRQDGTGLGLACVLLILTRLGGTLTIDSEPEKGTAVTVLLPLSPCGHHIH